MQKQSDLGGVAAMLATTAFFVIGDSFMKVVTEDLPSVEIMFIRAIAGALVCAIAILARGEWRVISTLFHPRTLVRAIGDTLSALLYVAALARLPISDVTAILQLTPVLVIIGGALLLRERIGAVPIVLALIGFAGALMVAQPSASGIPPAALIALGSALLGVVRDLGGRVVPAHIPLMVVILACMLVMIVVAGGLMVLGFQDWVAPTGRHLGFLTIAATLIVCGNFGILLAYRIGRTEVVAPFYYSFALWGIVSGLIVWGVLPNALAVVGTALIAGSGIAIVVLNQRRLRVRAAVSLAPD